MMGLITRAPRCFVTQFPDPGMPESTQVVRLADRQHLILRHVCQSRRQVPELSRKILMNEQ